LVCTGLGCHDDEVIDPLAALLLAAREGDDHAVRDLVQRTQPVVWRLCSALGSPGEEDDLVQETYLRALRAWLLAIARYVCADHVRRRQRQRRLVERITRLAPAATSTDSHSTAGLHELIDGLHPDRREAFVLTQLVGLSYDEAAEVLGCPIGTIRSRVARARADLLQTLSAAEAR
jgi:RNA polymerase sigma-70 factor (ECF subfamily)